MARKKTGRMVGGGRARAGSHLESQRRRTFQEEEVVCDAYAAPGQEEVAANRSPAWCRVSFPQGAGDRSSKKHKSR